MADESKAGAGASDTFTRCWLTAGRVHTEHPAARACLDHAIDGLAWEPWATEVRDEDDIEIAAALIKLAHAVKMSAPQRFAVATVPEGALLALEALNRYPRARLVIALPNPPGEMN